MENLPVPKLPLKIPLFPDEPKLENHIDRLTRREALKRSARVTLLKPNGTYNLSWVLPSSNLDQEGKNDGNQEKQDHTMSPMPILSWFPIFMNFCLIF
ncbi:hypothetical protein [Sulfidibacter corallicola]|uniref:Uncharacterized protein n=1 Tax=Sulfidibacter corallicola TaxID=2818388 RepID=A0A8A4TK44_SULCO|nr:hypothetical protein [Sulfidibacter corallicola]QTD49920.1 hypothetical protein J3U87_30430 [Sulfidibacter corallicola]